MIGRMIIRRRIGGVIELKCGKLGTRFVNIGVRNVKGKKGNRIVGIRAKICNIGLMIVRER